MEGLLGDVRVDGGWLHSVLSYMTAPEAGVDRSYTDEKSSWIRHFITVMRLTSQTQTCSWK